MTPSTVPAAWAPHTGWRALGATLLVLACTGIGRSGGMALASTAWAPRRGPPELDGLLLGWGILAASATGGAALWLVVRSRAPRAYLALERPSARAVLAALAASAVLVVTFDALRWIGAGSVVPTSWLEIARTAPAPLLVIAFALAAPCFEEAFFRGFLQSTLAATRLGPRGGLALTAALFTLAHGPGDALGAADVLASAVLLGVLRERTGSIVPGIVAHALGNLQAIVVATILATG